jgi:hypothetical protein
MPCTFMHPYSHSYTSIFYSQLSAGCMYWRSTVGVRERATMLHLTQPPSNITLHHSAPHTPPTDPHPRPCLPSFPTPRFSVTPTTPSTYLAPRQAAGYVSGYGCVVWLALCLTSRSACRLRWCQVLAVLCGYHLDFTICLHSRRGGSGGAVQLQLGLMVTKKKGHCIGPLCQHPQWAPPESTRADPNPLGLRLGPSEPARTPSESAEPHRNHQAPIRTTWVSSEPPEPHRDPLGLVRVYLSVSEFALVNRIAPVCVRACAPTVSLTSISI